MLKLNRNIVDKIDKNLFPKHYRPNPNLTLIEKVQLSMCLNNIQTVGNQIKSLVNEFEYQRDINAFNMWYNSKCPNFMYILYQILLKKKDKNYVDKNFNYLYKYNSFDRGLGLLVIFYQYNNN
jgi:hypothetical protein